MDPLHLRSSFETPDSFILKITCKLNTARGCLHFEKILLQIFQIKKEQGK